MYCVCIKSYAKNAFLVLVFFLYRSKLAQNLAEERSFTGILNRTDSLDEIIEKTIVRFLLGQKSPFL